MRVEDFIASVSEPYCEAQLGRGFSESTVMTMIDRLGWLTRLTRTLKGMGASPIGLHCNDRLLSFS